MRHFLANWSKDALADTINTTIKISSERFKASGLKMKERNFLEIYDKFHYIKDRILPELYEGQNLEIKQIMFSEGMTTPPKLLNETDLITLMDKNGIGTDATIHEHIKTI